MLQHLARAYVHSSHPSHSISSSHGQENTTGRWHPNVLGIVDAWEEDEALFIRTELCALGSFSRFLWEFGRQFERLDESRVWKIAADLSSVRRIPPSFPSLSRLSCAFISSCTTSCVRSSCIYPFVDSDGLRLPVLLVLAVGRTPPTDDISLIQNRVSPSCTQAAYSTSTSSPPTSSSPPPAGSSSATLAWRRSGRARARRRRFRVRVRRDLRASSARAINVILRLRCFRADTELPRISSGKNLFLLVAVAFEHCCRVALALFCVGLSVLK